MSRHMPLEVRVAIEEDNPSIMRQEENASNADNVKRFARSTSGFTVHMTCKRPGTGRSASIAGSVRMYVRSSVLRKGRSTIP